MNSAQIENLSDEDPKDNLGTNTNPRANSQIRARIQQSSVIYSNCSDAPGYRMPNINQTTVG